MADVFVSYKREERESAKALAEALEAYGFTVWWDVDLLPGEQYRAVILQILEKCRAAIVLWSPDFAASHWVLDEASRALSKNKLLPVIIAPLPDMPLGFGQLHTHKLIGWDGAPEAIAFEPILAGVERLVGRPRTPLQKTAPAAPPPAPTPTDVEGEVAFWRGVQDSKNISDLRAYLARYGDKGLFADLARERIVTLTPAPTPPPPPPNPPPPKPAPPPAAAAWTRVDPPAITSFLIVWAAWLTLSAVFFYMLGSNIGGGLLSNAFGHMFPVLAISLAVLVAIALSGQRLWRRFAPSWPAPLHTAAAIAPPMLYTFAMTRGAPVNAGYFIQYAALGLLCYVVPPLVRNRARSAPQTQSQTRTKWMQIDATALIAFLAVWALLIVSFIIVGAFAGYDGDIARSAREIILEQSGLPLLVTGAVCAVTLILRRVGEHFAPAASPYAHTAIGLIPAALLLMFLFTREMPHGADLAGVIAIVAIFVLICHYVPLAIRKRRAA